MSDGSTARDVNGATASVIPPVIPGWTGQYLGYGIVLYTPNVFAFAVSSSETQIYFPVNKGHKLKRIQVSQFVASTGVLDPSGLAVQIRKNDYYYGGQQTVQASTTAYPSTIAAATNINEFDSEGWDMQSEIYTIAVTGQNSDSVTVAVFLQYTVEPDNPTIKQG